MEAKKREKREEGVNVGLEDLPVEILLDIIGRLPIKETIQTSLIAQRWRNLWKRISKVELVQGHGKREEFTNFVDNFLAIFNDLLLVTNFSLVCEVGDDTPLVNQWLSGFINPKIEELRLVFNSVEEPLVFPDELFISENLRHFHLSMPHVINLPDLIYFRSLKTLTLKYVIFPNPSTTQNLFTSCPSLEEVTLIDCIWTYVGAVCIVCPSLKKLIIREWKDDDEEDEEDNYDNALVDQAEDDDDEELFCQIVIIGTDNMQTFHYGGDMLNDYILYCASSLIDGTVDVHPSPANTSLDAAFFVLKLLLGLSFVQKLSISQYAAEALSSESFLIPNIPVFNNLVELRVVSVSPMNFACDALQTILRRSPKLETIHFIMGVSLDKNAVIPKENNVNTLPACFETCLKTIRICGFKGSEEEMLAIELLLKSTPVLDLFSVSRNAYDFETDGGSEKLDKLLQQIRQFPTASADCEFRFD